MPHPDSSNISQDNDLIGLFVRPIHDAGLRYLVAGSVAAMHYSEPRLTIDIDVPIFLGGRDIRIIESCFCSGKFYCPPHEVMEVECGRECRGHFNIIHISTGLKADFYPGNRDATFAWAWRNKLQAETDSGPIFLAPLEYVILWKLIYYSEGKSPKHLRDIARILEVQTHLAHKDFLFPEIQTRGLQSAWDEVRQI